MILYDTCITFYAIYCKHYGTAQGSHLPDLYKFKIILTNYITLKLFSFLLTTRNFMKIYSVLQIGKNKAITTGILTRVDHLRINE